METESKAASEDRPAGGAVPCDGRKAVPQRPGGVISSNREIAIVQADYLALANDLEQAQALATSLEMELSGKTNELAQFKLIWERSQEVLAKMEQDIETLRTERHSLANEVQRGRAFEHKCQRLQTANEELKAQVERLESDLARECEAHGQRGARLSGPPVAGRQDRDARLRHTLEELRIRIDRALESSDGRPAVSEEPESIEIEFGA